MKLQVYHYPHLFSQRFPLAMAIYHQCIIHRQRITDLYTDRENSRRFIGDIPIVYYAVLYACMKADAFHLTALRYS